VGSRVEGEANLYLERSVVNRLTPLLGVKVASLIIICLTIAWKPRHVRPLRPRPEEKRGYRWGAFVRCQKSEIRGSDVRLDSAEMLVLADLTLPIAFSTNELEAGELEF
jgi:hypothetical protein